MTAVWTSVMANVTAFFAPPLISPPSPSLLVAPLVHLSLIIAFFVRFF